MKYLSVKCYLVKAIESSAEAISLGEIIVRKPLIPYDNNGQYVTEIFTGEKIRVYDNYSHEKDREYSQSRNYRPFLINDNKYAYMIKSDALNDPKNAVSKQNILDYYTDVWGTKFFETYIKNKRKYDKKANEGEYYQLCQEPTEERIKLEKTIKKYKDQWGKGTK